jgi:histidinol-phosphatase
MFIGEEFGASDKAKRRWIVDPIDGTKNFAHGNPVYGTLIALEEDGQLTIAYCHSLCATVRQT